MCYSENGVYFSRTIYAIEGVLLAFGVFLAWETRRVSNLDNLDVGHVVLHQLTAWSLMKTCNHERRARYRTQNVAPRGSVLPFSLK